jgi:hypothetical protein
VLSAAYSLNSDHLDGNDSTHFLDTSSGQQMKAGSLVLSAGLQAFYGIESTGAYGGGYFADGNESGYAYLGYGHRGIEAYGSYVGGLFQDSDHSGYGYVGYGDRGVHARGSEVGGYFGDTDGSGYAYVGFGDVGIEARGEDGGGHFYDSGNSGYAYVGYGDYGIRAFGTIAGGYFKDANHTGYANIGYGNSGVSAHGTTAGGYFTDSDGSGKVYSGYGDRGVHATGDEMGGYFEDTNESGWANVGWGAHGIYAVGNWAGGEFHDGDQGAWALVGHGVDGIYATGAGAGGNFGDSDDSGWAWVGMGSYKIFGNGSVDFVQNHPDRDDRVIVYAAPEGDEVATYTRGTGRLLDGEARVPLGKTFKWVTNPDIGLTAYVTPRGEPIPLSVASLTTEELLVRGPAGSDATFDFIVYGLRIGFEEVSVVQEKIVESFIPSMKDHRERYERHPELRRFNALERFKEMAFQATGTDDLNLERAAALKARIEEYDFETHGPVSELLGHGPSPRLSPVGTRTEPDRGAATLEQGQAVQVVDRKVETRAPAAVGLSVTDVARIGLTDTRANSLAPTSWNGAWMPASGPFEPGDILVLDAERAGFLHRSRQMADSSMIGVAIVSEDRSESDGEAAALQTLVALTGLVVCKVDAGYGAIRVGDLLTSSPTPGHAMRAFDPLPGTVLGKALEPLDSGSGSIRVLLMPR